MSDKTSEPRQLDATSTATVKASDVKVFGDPDVWELLCKASSEAGGWMRSTKVMHQPDGGKVIQASTVQRNPDGSYAVAEALVYVPPSSVEQHF